MIRAIPNRRLPVRFGIDGAVSARLLYSLTGTATAALRLPLLPVGILWASLSAPTDRTARVGAPR